MCLDLVFRTLAVILVSDLLFQIDFFWGGGIFFGFFFF